ncbi:hypothetical protein D3C86_2116810 [compost metagenome]
MASRFEVVLSAAKALVPKENTKANENRTAKAFFIISPPNNMYFDYLRNKFY